jgi:glutamate-1-semialdehyde 2,1-aminomutase
MTRSSNKSAELYARAVTKMPAGVSSPVRAFRHVGGTPIYMSRGEGAFVTDEDGNRYVDFCLAWGPMILGHAHPAVIDAVTRAAKDGLAFGTVHRHEVELAELILAAFSWADRVRLVVSGTEAVQTALRLARAHTGRRPVLKFSGCYHGHSDSMLVKAGSGLVTQGLSDSAGVFSTGETFVAPLGDMAALETAFNEQQLAAVIVEPLPGNNGLLIQDRAWLKALRDKCQAHGALLIFDEVISGFRFGYHGYGKVVDVEPDLTTLGKIVGGGLPVAAVVGRGEIIDRLAPLGPVYQAGTMAANPVALAAGIATLKELKTGRPYVVLQELGEAFDRAAEAVKKQVQLARVGSVFWPYLDTSTKIPTQAEQISSTAIEAFRARYRGWLEAGHYLPPSAYEVGFLSSAHTTEQVEAMVRAVGGA